MISVCPAVRHVAPSMGKIQGAPLIWPSRLAHSGRLAGQYIAQHASA
jgi:hypothetical protein